MERKIIRKGVFEEFQFREWNKSISLYAMLLKKLKCQLKRGEVCPFHAAWASPPLQCE